MSSQPGPSSSTPIILWTGAGAMEGVFEAVPAARGVVVLPFASSRWRNRPSTRQLTRELQSAALSTLAVDLLTPDEEQIDSRTEHYRLDIPFLARRIGIATEWVRRTPSVSALPTGYFASGVSAAAAFFAADRARPAIQAIVCYEGAPDLAASLFAQLSIPTLLLVDEDNVLLIARNREAFRQLQSDKELILMSEDRDLVSVARLAADWFVRFFGARQTVPDHEADAKGAVESQMQRLQYVEGDEVLGYMGEAHEEHTGEPVAALAKPE